MRLYTICVQQPILVMSIDVQLPMEDAFTTDPVLMQAYRASRQLEAKMQAKHPEMFELSDMREIDDALDTWLGEDLQFLMSNGKSIWNGNRDSLTVREAQPDEAERWRQSLEEAIESGEKDAGDEDWLAFLVPVTESVDELD